MPDTINPNSNAVEEAKPSPTPPRGHGAKIPPNEAVEVMTVLKRPKNAVRRNLPLKKLRPAFLIETKRKSDVKLTEPIKTNGKLDLMAMIIKKVEDDPAKFIDELMSESKHNLTLRKDILDRLVGKAGEQQQQAINVYVISYKNADLNSSMISSSPGVNV